MSKPSKALLRDVQTIVAQQNAGHAVTGLAEALLRPAGTNLAG
jgi:hypothetical protein